MKASQTRDGEFLKKKEITLVVIQQRRKYLCMLKVFYEKGINTLYYFVVGYFNEGFQHRIYIYIYICYGLNAASSVCRGMYTVIFATKEIGMSVATYGKIVGISSLVSAGVFFRSRQGDG